MYRLKSPLTVQIELTEACNNACYHCYNYWRYIETGKKLSVDSHENTLYHFEVLLDHLIRNEVMTVSFTGGEPFLRRDILFYLIRKAKQGGMKAGVNTNGALSMKTMLKGWWMLELIFYSCHYYPMIRLSTTKWPILLPIT